MFNKLLLGALVSLFLCTGAKAQSRGMKVTAVIGSSNVKENTIVGTKTPITTGINSLLFGFSLWQGTKVGLNPNSSFIYEYEESCVSPIDRSTGRVSSYSVLYGAFVIEVPPLFSTCSRVLIQSRKGLTIVRKSKVSLTQDIPNREIIGVANGFGTVRSGIYAVTVPPNQYTQLIANNPPTVPRAADRKLELNIDSVSGDKVFVSTAPGNVIITNEETYLEKAESTVGSYVEVRNPLAETKSYQLVYDY